MFSKLAQWGLFTILRYPVCDVATQRARQNVWLFVAMQPDHVSHLAFTTDLYSW